MGRFIGGEAGIPFGRGAEARPQAKRWSWGAATGQEVKLRCDHRSGGGDDVGPQAKRWYWPVRFKCFSASKRCTGQCASSASPLPSSGRWNRSPHRPCHTGALLTGNCFFPSTTLRQISGELCRQLFKIESQHTISSLPQRVDGNRKHEEWLKFAGPLAQGVFRSCAPSLRRCF